MLIGYMRVSTAEQSLDLQRDALEQAGCDKIYQPAFPIWITFRHGNSTQSGSPSLLSALTRSGRCILIRGG
ncbi:recombinase family protein, partial [Aurantimonas sp. C2-4-R8]|nr:recombinase family protein [Aurantimonas sp. C2-4-R8]